MRTEVQCGAVALPGDRCARGSLFCHHSASRGARIPHSHFTDENHMFWGQMESRVLVWRSQSHSLHAQGNIATLARLSFLPERKIKSYLDKPRYPEANYPQQGTGNQTDQKMPLLQPQTPHSPGPQTVDFTPVFSNTGTRLMAPSMCWVNTSQSRSKRPKANLSDTCEGSTGKSVSQL